MSIQTQKLYFPSTCYLQFLLWILLHCVWIMELLQVLQLLLWLVVVELATFVAPFVIVASNVRLSLHLKFSHLWPMNSARANWSSMILSFFNVIAAMFMFGGRRGEDGGVLYLLGNENWGSLHKHWPGELQDNKAHRCEAFPKWEVGLGHHLTLGPLFWGCPRPRTITLS